MASVAEDMAAVRDAVQRAVDASRPKWVELTRSLNEGIERARQQAELAREQRRADA